MITLERACEIYEEKGSYWPIGYITENETEWAFFEVNDGYYDVNIPVVNKETGELDFKRYLPYADLPQVPVPARFVKDPPPKTCHSGIAAFFGGPLVMPDGRVIE